jgi:hypothetical protein
LEFGEATESPISSRSQLAPAKPAPTKPAPTKPARTFDDDDAWIVTPDEPIAPSAADDEIGTLEFGDAAEPTISDSIKIGEPIVVTTPPMIESILTTTVSAGRTAMIQPVAAPISPAAPISATMSISIANEVMDEEVVIDRYAALDAALNRLTRTMLCARAVSRRNDSNPIGRAKPELIPIDDEDDSDSAAFDVVLPDEVARVETTVATAAEKPRQESRLETATTDKGSRLLSGRRYERLFSELRRRRIGA